MTARRAITLLLPTRTPGILATSYHYFRHVRQVSAVTAGFYCIVYLAALGLLRLESPAWQTVLRNEQTLFPHLTKRPLRVADPLRYLLQAMWLLLVRQEQSEAESAPSTWRYQWRQFSGRYLRRAQSTYLRALTQLPKRIKSRAVTRRSAIYFRRMRPGQRRILFGFLISSTLALAILCVTEPFNWTGQFLFVVLLWSIAMMVRRIPGRFSTLMLIVLSVTVSCRYLWWRYTSTLNWDNGLDLVCGLILLAAETYSWIVLVIGYIQTIWPLNRQPAALPADTSQWPTVDLFIPTYSEDLNVVRPTVFAAMGLDWPKDKLRIYILDDGKRPAFRAFAEEVGVNYLVRTDNRHAKAGNLNHALGQTRGELIAIFDCDHIPTRSFLQLTVGEFLQDPKLALVQTPHHFFSPDPFERNLGHFGAKPNENTLFYGLIQNGNDTWNAAFFCGSCAVLRRTAVESIGGFAVQTVTEDAHTSLRLHRKGWNSAYIRIPQAAGLATESLSAHVGQRIRWARGMVQIFRLENPLLGKGLSFFQRLCYLNAMMHFLSGLPRIIFLTAPLAFLLLHAYILYAPTLAILLYVLPHMIHVGLTNSHTQGRYRYTFWGEMYETVLSWYIARPTLVALFFPHRGKFNVTAKGGLVEHDYFDWAISRPYIVLAFMNFIGLVFGIWRLWTGPSDEIGTVLVSLSWVLYNLIIIGGAVGVAAEVRQVRRAHRVPTHLPASIRLPDGHRYPCVLHDYAEGGAGIVLPQSGLVNQDMSVTLFLRRGQREFAFSGKVLRIQDQAVGIRFDDMDVPTRLNFVQCTFARADSWLTWRNSFKRDRPLRSLNNLLEMGFRGYRRLAEYAPFPLRGPLRAAISLLLWLLTFCPRTVVIPSSLPSRPPQ
jgi:cellulose synthase (UDP-forming)